MGVEEIKAKFTEIKAKLTSTAEQGEEAEAFIESEEMSETGNSWIPSVWGNEVKEDPWLPSMSKKQRLMGFLGCLFGGWLCFGLSIIYIPFILLKARKFVLLFSLGSVFTLGSFSMLWGPWNHIQHLFSRTRLPFTIAYLSTLTATIYSAMILHATLLTLFCSAAQLTALLWYVFSYIPGGVTGLKFFTKLFANSILKSCEATLPI